MTRLLPLMTLLAVLPLRAAAADDWTWPLDGALSPALEARRAHQAAEPLPHMALRPDLAAAGHALYDNGPQGLYDVQRVDVELFVQPGTNSLTTFVDLTLVNGVEGATEIELVYDQPPIDWVRLPDDTPLEAQATGSGLLTVVPDHVLAQGEEWTFRMAATGALDCSGSMVAACDFGADITYVTHAGYFPRNLNGADTFVGTLRVAVPKGYRSGATGTLVAAYEQGQAFVSEHVHSVPTEFFSFAVAAYEPAADQPSDWPVTVLARAEYAQNAQAMIPLVDDVLQQYGARYVPYPWVKIDVVEIGNSFGGGYGPLSSIFLLSWAFQVPPDHFMGDFVRNLVSHELGHQWWGNLVNIWSPDSIVLSEGFAEFSSCYYDELVTGERGQFFENAMIYTYQVPADQDKPITYYQVYASEYYQPIMYQKGSYLLEMLRHELGDDTFFAAMKEFATRFGYQYAHVSDWMAVVEEVAGEDLDWFWGPWFYKAGLPRYTITASQEGEELVLHVEQTQEEPVFTMTLPVVVRSPAGESTTTRVRVTDRATDLRVPLPEGGALSVSIDPERRNLRRLRLGDPADANLDGVVNGLDVLRAAAATNRNLVHDGGHRGGGFFHPDPGYVEFLDLEMDGRVDDADWAVFAEAFVN